MFRQLNRGSRTLRASVKPLSSMRFSISLLTVICIASVIGTVAAWSALSGLAVTSFCFPGVNMFLSGLHSYGTLQARAPLPGWSRKDCQG